MGFAYKHSHYTFYRARWTIPGESLAQGYFRLGFGLYFKYQLQVNCFAWNGTRTLLFHGQAHPRWHGPDNSFIISCVSLHLLAYLLIVNSIFRNGRCLVYEIYPQHETPQLIQIAHFVLDPSKHHPVHLLQDTVIWYKLCPDCTVFSVWDYRVNHSISFSGDVCLDGSGYTTKVFCVLFKILNYFPTPLL